MKSWANGVALMLSGNRNSQTPSWLTSSQECKARCVNGLPANNYWALVNTYSIKLKTIKTMAYHPQMNGLTQRLNKRIADMLYVSVDTEHMPWDEVLLHTMFAYNNSAIREMTQDTPFESVCSRPCCHDDLNGYMQRRRSANLLAYVLRTSSWWMPCATTSDAETPTTTPMGTLCGFGLHFCTHETSGASLTPGRRRATTPVPTMRGGPRDSC